MGPRFLLFLVSLSGQGRRQLSDLANCELVPAAQGLDRQWDEFYALLDLGYPNPVQHSVFFHFS